MWDILIISRSRRYLSLDCHSHTYNESRHHDLPYSLPLPCHRRHTFFYSKERSIITLPSRFNHRYPSHLRFTHHHLTMKFSRKSITMDSFFFSFFYKSPCLWTACVLEHSLYQIRHEDIQNKSMRWLKYLRSQFLSYHPISRDKP